MANTKITAANIDSTSTGFTLADLTVNGDITGTLATAAQPNITSLGTLTGLTSTGNLVIGTEDNNAAIIEISGGATGSAEGGEIRLDTAADYDGTYEFYRLDVSEDDFRIGRAGQTDFTIFSNGTAQFFGNLAATLSTAAQPNITSVGTLTALTGGTGDLNWDSGTLFVDSSANAVGIGTTSPTHILHVQGTSNDTIDETKGTMKVQASGGNGMILGTIASSPYTSYIQSAYVQDTSLAQYNLALNPIGGNVGIGTTSPSANLHVNRNTNTANNVDSLGFDVAATIGNAATNPGNHFTSGLRLFQGSGTVGSGLGVFYLGADNGTAAATNDYTGQLYAPSGMTGGIKLNAADSSATIRFETAGSEAMRIDASGNVEIGGSTNTGSFKVINTSTQVCVFDRRGTDGAVVLIRNDDVNVGSISVSGSSTAYNTSSDYRLKENVVEMEGAIDRVKLLQPKRFNFIADADKTVDGFLAHEVSDIVPEAIHGIKDEVDEEGNPVYQGIDQSKLIPLLTKAIQEQQTIIDDLKSRIEALEG